MSADSLDGWEPDEAEPSRDASREPGLDAAYGRAFAELAAVNAELYKRIDYLEQQLKLRDDRFCTWAREFAWHDEMTKSRVEQLEHIVTELQQSADPGGPDGRIGNRADAEDEKHAGLERARARPSNEAIATTVAVAGIAITATGEIVGTHLATDIGAYVGQVAAAGAAGLAWMRKLREGKNADRS